MGGPQMVVPQNEWVYNFIMENPIKMDDFRGTPILGNLQMLLRFLVPSFFGRKKIDPDPHLGCRRPA